MVGPARGVVDQCSTAAVLFSRTDVRLWQFVWFIIFVPIAAVTAAYSTAAIILVLILQQH